MNRPLHGPQNPTPVDHATDTYDTIDWLVKNIPGEQRQGRHSGHLVRWLPALDGAGESASGAESFGAHEPHGGWLEGRRLVPQRRVSPIGDAGLHPRPGGHARVGHRSGGPATTTITTRTWKACRRAKWGAAHGLEQLGFWRKILEHPSYDAFWRDQAVDRVLAAQPLKVPVMLVDSLWDQEDIYGAMAVYKAIKPKDTHQRQGVSGDGAVASRPGDRRREHPRPAAFRQRYRALLPPRDSAPVSGSISEGWRAESRSGAGLRV